MENLNEKLTSKYGKSLAYKLESNYQKQYDSNMIFRKLANDLGLPKEKLMKYTSQLESSVKELEHCKGCKNILECQNSVEGYVLYPEKNEESIEFCYIPCEYKKILNKQNLYKENIFYFDIAEDIKNASMKDIDTKDKNRFATIKWIKEYLSDYQQKIYHKGIYLNGSFGSGKTYLLSAMLNEFAKKGRHVAIIYYPEFLRTLKESFGNDEFKSKFNYIKKVEFLLLDDIGAESLTEWSRDEVLGTILQYRMEEKLPTFFTSNLTLDELEVHLSTTSKDVDKVKARRIIERIKQLSDSMVLISENKRK